MSVTALLNMSTTWEQETINSGNINNIARDVGQLTLNYTFQSGIGSGRIDQMFDEYRVLPSGGSLVYDLLNLTGSVLENSVSKSFSKIKAISIKNYETLSGKTAWVDVSSASGFGLAFGNPTTIFFLNPNSHYSSSNIFGWPTTGNQRFIGITNNNTGTLAYEINLLGQR